MIAGLKLSQGFDVGLEMSGNPRAFDQIVETTVMGGRVAMLGIPPGRSPVDWSRIVCKAITIKGIHGREIFETWYKMLALLENGLNIRPSSPTASPPASMSKASPPCGQEHRARGCRTGRP